MTLSLVIGGESSSNRPLIRKVRSLGSMAKEQSVDLAPDSDAAGLDIVFKVSGPIAAGDFEGVEVGKWVSDKRLMVMQVGVPEEVPGGDVDGFLQQMLPVVVERARSHLAKKKIDASLDQADTVVTGLVASLGESA